MTMEKAMSVQASLRRLREIFPSPNRDLDHPEGWDGPLRCPYCGEMNCITTVEMSFKEGWIYFITRKCSRCKREWLEQWEFKSRSTCM